MAQNISFLDNPRTCILKISSDGSDKIDDNNFIVIIGVAAFVFLNFVGLILLGVILGLTSHEETLTIDKQSQTLTFKKLTTTAGVPVSQRDITCALEEVDCFTEETSSATTTITLILPLSKDKKQTLKFPLNKISHRNIYNTLIDLFQGASYRARRIASQNNPQVLGQSARLDQPLSSQANSANRQRVKPDAYAPNITITDDEMIYRRTLVTARDYWGMYWSFVRSVIFIVVGVSLAIFVIFPLIRTSRNLYAVYVPLGLVALGFIFMGIHTILFKLIATKTTEIVHFNKMAQVVTLDDKFLTSKSTRKYLFEQVELKLEKQQIGDGTYLERTHVVTLVFDVSSPNPRKVELMKTMQSDQAIDLYNTIAEVLHRPTLPFGTTGA